MNHGTVYFSSHANDSVKRVISMYGSKTFHVSGFFFFFNKNQFKKLLMPVELARSSGFSWI